MASVNCFNPLNHIDAISDHQVESVVPLLLRLNLVKLENKGHHTFVTVISALQINIINLRKIIQ